MQQDVSHNIKAMIYHAPDFIDQDASVEALLLWLDQMDVSLKGLDGEELQGILASVITEIDRQLNQQLNAIIHHEKFKRLESSWRGVLYLASQECQIDREEQIELRLLSVSWQEMARDFSRAIEFDQSHLYRLIYSHEFDQAGGTPYGMLIGDYQVSNRIRPGHALSDLDIVRNMAQVAAAAFAPFITAATPQLFGVNRFSDLGSTTDINAHFEQPEYVQWRSLRESEDSRYLGLAVPYMLMRKPYYDDGRYTKKFNFKESLVNSDQDYLWGNIAYSFAVVVMRSFAESKWFAQIRGVNKGAIARGLVDQLPHCHYEPDLYRHRIKYPVDLFIGDRLEKQLSEAGFVPLSVIQHTDKLAFFSNSAVQKPVEYNDKVATVNARLATMLQYILCVSRFAHSIKVLGREKVGSYQTARQIQNDIQKWLQGYTAASENSSDEVRSKRPLSEARIEVNEVKGKPGRFYSIIHLKPHFQLDQMVSSIRLITELTANEVTT